MSHDEASPSPIMRLFEVRVKPGCRDALLAKFATTSAAVVQDEPGNLGYFLGKEIASDQDDVVVFASFWASLDAIKARFGENWRVSFLPEGYEAMIDTCSVRHIDLSPGWHARLDGESGAK